MLNKRRLFLNAAIIAALLLPGLMFAAQAQQTGNIAVDAAGNVTGKLSAVSASSSSSSSGASSSSGSSSSSSGSSSGTATIPPAQSMVCGGATWTIAANLQVMRNGAHAGNSTDANGMACVAGVTIHRNTAGNCYAWVAATGAWSQLMACPAIPSAASAGSSSSSSSGGSSSSGVTVGAPLSSPAALLTYARTLTAAHKILAGQHTEHWGTPMQPVNDVKAATGKDVAAISVSLDQDGVTEDVVGEANAWGDKGGITQVTWQPHDPSTGRDANSTVDLSQIYTVGGQYNAIWNAYVDGISAKLAGMKYAYFLRLFCEMNGDWSWWGNRDPAQFKALWQYTWARLKGNGVMARALIVFPPNSWGNAAAFYPGNAYVDVGSWDAYPPTAGDPTYAFLKSTGKPIYLSETGVIGSNNDALALNQGDNSQLLAYVKANFPLVFAIEVFCQKWCLGCQKGEAAFMNDPAIVTLAGVPH